MPVCAYVLVYVDMHDLINRSARTGLRSRLSVYMDIAYVGVCAHVYFFMYVCVSV